MNDGLDCCFPELEVGDAEALGSAGVLAPFIIAVAIVERGFLMLATGGSETWDVRNLADYAQERLPRAAPKSDSGLPTPCLR